MWLKGQTVSELHAEVTEQIRPFRNLSEKGIPADAVVTYQKNWKPIFQYLEDGLKSEYKYNLPSQIQEISNEDISKCYDLCMELLKKRVSYCFNKKRLK